MRTYKLINSTNGKTLADRVFFASNFASRLRGLMGRAFLAKDEGLAIYPCNSIHTCFMRFPIDVLFVDPQGKTLKSVESIRPFRFTPFVSGAYLVVELAAGRAAETGTGPGDYLKFYLEGEFR